MNPAAVTPLARPLQALEQDGYATLPDVASDAITAENGGTEVIPGSPPMTSTSLPRRAA